MLDFYETAGPKLFAERVNAMIEGDPIIDREVADGPRKTFDHARSDTLQKMETATKLTLAYQPIDPHFGDVGIIRAIGEKFVRVAEIVNRSEPDGRLIEQPKPDRQGDRCAACGLKRRDHNYSGAAYGVCGKFIEPTPDAAEASAVLLRGWAKAYRDTPEHRFPSDPNAEFFPIDLEHAADLLSAPSQPAPDAVRISDAQLSEGIKWIDWNDALNVHDEMKQLRKAVERMFCLPLPTDCPPNLTEEICTIVDQCRSGHVIGAECAKAIYSAVAKYAALSIPVPPADGTRDLTNDEETLVRRALIASGTTIEELFSSITGAAEPVAWRMRTPDGRCTSWFDGKPPKYSQHYEVAYTIPPVRVDHEAIALKLAQFDGNGDGTAFYQAMSSHDRKIYRQRAAEILSLPVQPGAGEREAVIEKCAKIAEPWPGYWLDEKSTDADRAVVAVRTEIAKTIRDLAANQPRSEEHDLRTRGDDRHTLGPNSGLLDGENLSTSVKRARQAPHSSSGTE